MMQNRELLAISCRVGQHTLFWKVIWATLKQSSAAKNKHTHLVATNWPWHALAWHALDHHDFRALNHSILSLWWRRFCCLKQGKAGHKVNCFWASNLQTVKLNKWRPPSEVDSTPSIVCLYLPIKTFALMLETVDAVVRKSANAVAARHVHHWGHHLLRLGYHQAMSENELPPCYPQVQGDHPKGFRISSLGHCAHLRIAHRWSRHSLTARSQQYTGTVHS